NDVRGAEISIDPRSGETVDPVDSFVRSRGAELGMRWERDEQFNITVTAFNLELDSELLFVGDAGTTEPVGSSTRRGVELNAFWQPMPEVVFNAGYSYTDAEFDEATGGGVEIPGAIAESASMGATWAFIENGFVSVRGRYLGDAPLIEDGSVKSGSSLLVNLAAGYRWEQVELRIEAFNLTDSTDNDIAYFFASRLGDEPADGVEDIHMHPLEPRALRASVTFNF
ncbi:MAG: TonB-dependent receptor, partial [Pseudomonadota bacterium]